MAWGSVRPVAIQKRSAESASALRTLAEDLRIKTTNVNTEYVSDPLLEPYMDLRLLLGN